MNLQNIFNEIETVDPEVYDRLDTRRNSMKQFASIGKALAAIAIPSAVGTMFKKAYGQTPTDVLDVLNFALTLEYLEAEFYKAAVASPAVAATTVSAADRAALTIIRDHEVAHVAFLRAAITASGGTPVTFTAASFDFSGGKGSGTGPFAPAFTAAGYPVLLAAAQTFEDTGVRAYKGQAGRLINNNDVLTAALQIHSVEARHAAKIRYMRRLLGAAIPAGVTLQPWITLNQSGINFPPGDAAIQKSYNGEEVVTQAGVTITGINGQAVSANEASESFDEPLTKEQILDIVSIFIK